jgi:cardiolipin synthase
VSWDFLDGQSFTVVTSAVLFVAQVAGVLTAMHAIPRVRTAQATTAWCVGLLSLPLLIVPAYWVFGRSRFFSYRETLRRVREQQSGPAKEFGRYLDRLVEPGEESRLPLHSVAKVVDQPVTHGNQLQPLIDGEQTFAAMKETISRAESYLLVQFFIIQDDFIGNEFAEALIERARAGLRVFLLYDDIGCHWLPQHYLDMLTEAGVRVASFSNRRRLFHRLEVNFRNHRKLIIADGCEALTGGLNVGDEYLDGGNKFSVWRDTHLRVRGPAVQALQAVFCQDWYWSRLEVIEGLAWEEQEYASTSEDAASHQDDDDPAGQTLVVPTGPADRRQYCTMMFCEMAAVAERRLWISTPYFVPNEAVATALEAAASRGVEVRILVPARPDHLLVYLAGHYYEDVIGSVGVHVYRYSNGFLHQKAVLVDDTIAAIGSANLDNRSLLLNFEVMVASSDPKFVGDVQAMLEKDFARAKRTAEDVLAERPFWFRMLVFTARLFSPVL